MILLCSSIALRPAPAAEAAKAAAQRGSAAAAELARPLLGGGAEVDTTAEGGAECDSLSRLRPAALDALRRYEDWRGVSARASACCHWLRVWF
jgi:hypothetical protein